MKHIKLFENFSNPEERIFEKKKAKKGLPPWLKKGKKKEECDSKEEDCDDKPAKKSAKGKPVAKKQSAKQAAFFKKMGWGKK